MSGSQIDGVIEFQIEALSESQWPARIPHKTIRIERTLSADVKRIIYIWPLHLYWQTLIDWLL